MTGGLDNLVKVWHFENNRLEILHILEGHCMAVVSVAVSYDGHSKPYLFTLTNKLKFITKNIYM